ncbi:MAG: hypothetical protein IJV39_01710 [Ruminococcus sp.]|nr:hypothetical protein [Ruminococcus sp.]
MEKTFSSRPDVVDLPENLDKYDTIYLCYPVWWFDVPMAVNTFLENYDFDGKTIIPVSSAIDNDITTTLDSVKNNAKNAKVTDGFTANNATKADIVSWLKK